VTVLSISKAWDESRETLGRDGKLLTTIALALMVLPGVVRDLVTPAAPPGVFPPLGYWTVVAVISLLIALAGQLAVIRLAIGSKLTVGEAIRHGARRVPAYLGATLMWVLPLAILIVVLLGKAGKDSQAGSPVAALGLVVLGCVGLYFAVRMLMASPVASAEPAGPVAILQRSWQMTSGHWWRLFAFFLLFVIAAVIVILAVAAVSGLLAQLILGGTAPLTIGGLFVSLVIQLASAAASVVLMVMLARIYVQLSGEGAAVKVPTSGS
jgi:hypothetical protein